MTVASCPTQACFDAWMKCEDLLLRLHQVKNSFSKKIIKVVDECALICMGTFHALKSSSQNASRFALLCIGICEECAEICEDLGDEAFRQCARVCRTCSERMSLLADQ